MNPFLATISYSSSGTSSFPIWVYPIIAVFGLLGFYKSYKRRQGLKAFAATRGWTYESNGDNVWVHIAQSFPFNTGHNQDVEEMISFTQNGYTVNIFDYSFQQGNQMTSGNNGDSNIENYRLMFISTDLPGVPVSAHFIKNKLAGLVSLGGKVKFESIEFNKHFQVYSSSKERAYAVVTEQVMDALMKWSPEILTWESGYLIYASKSRWQAKDIDGILEQMMKLVALIPAYLMTPEDNIANPAPVVNEATEVPPMTPATSIVEPIIPVVPTHFTPHRPGKPIAPENN